MAKHYVMNAELGSDATFDELISKLDNFDWQGCALTDAAKVIKAVRLLAEENVRRHKALRERETALAEREKVAEILDTIEQTVNINNQVNAKKRGYLWR
jgi:hypothetical protein